MDKLPANDLREQLEDIGVLASQSIAEVRQISRDLHPHQLDHLGLTRALKAMIDNAAESSGIQFKRKLEPVDDLFSKDAAMNLYRVVQESLNNILKHSGSKSDAMLCPNLSVVSLGTRVNVQKVQTELVDFCHHHPLQNLVSGQ